MTLQRFSAERLRAERAVLREAVRWADCHRDGEWSSWRQKELLRAVDRLLAAQGRKARRRG